MAGTTPTTTGQPRGMAPPPPGVVPNFTNPENQTPENIALHTVMLFFVTAAISVRLYTRAFIVRQLGLDDCLCIIAFAFICTYSGLLLAAAAEGYLGHHIWEIQFSTFLRGRKLDVWAQWVYLVIAATIKLSCLVFYRRILGPNRMARNLCYGGMAFIFSGYLAFLLTSILTCIPVARHFNPTVPGTCLPAGVTAYGSGALNVVTDVFVLVLPLPVIWRLNMKLSKKLKVTAVFALGIVVVALAITRLALTPMVFKLTDPTWALSEFSMYSVVELYIGMMCSCFLAFPSFLDRFGPRFMDKMRSYSLLGRSSRSSHSSEQTLREKFGGSARTSVETTKHYQPPQKEGATVTQGSGSNATRHSPAASSRLEYEASMSSL